MSQLAMANPDKESETCLELAKNEALAKLQDAWRDHEKFKFKHSASKFEYQSLVAYHKSFEHVIDKCIDYKKKLKDYEKKFKKNGKQIVAVCKKCKQGLNPFPTKTEKGSRRLGLCKARVQEFERSNEKHMEKAPNTIPTKKVKGSHSLGLRRDRYQEFRSAEEKHMEKAPNTNLTKKVKGSRSLGLRRARAQEFGSSDEKQMEKSPNPTKEGSGSLVLRRARLQEFGSSDGKQEKSPNPNPTKKVKGSHSLGLHKARAQEFESSKEKHMEEAPNANPTNKAKDAHGKGLLRNVRFYKRDIESLKEKYKDFFTDKQEVKDAFFGISERVQDAIVLELFGYLVHEGARKVWPHMYKTVRVKPLILELRKARAKLLEENKKFADDLAVCEAHAKVCESFKHLEKDPNSFLTHMVEFAEQLAICRARAIVRDKAEAHVVRSTFRKFLFEALKEGRKDDVLEFRDSYPICAGKGKVCGYLIETIKYLPFQERERFVAICNALRKEILPEDEILKEKMYCCLMAKQLFIKFIFC